MEQSGESRNRLTTIWLISLGQNNQECTMGKGQPLQLVVLGEMDNTGKRKTRLLSYIIYEINIKCIKDLNVIFENS